MTPPAELADLPRPAKSSKPGDGLPAPGLFLMTNSFETGGSERQFTALAESLGSSPFRLHLGCLSRSGSLFNSLNNVVEFPLGGNLYSAKSIRTRLRLAHYLRGRRISIAHAFDFYTNLTLIPAARMAKTPVVIGSQRQLGDLLSPAKSRAQMAVLRWCDHVVCNSRAAADKLIELGMPERQIAVIGNGLPASAFAQTVPALARQPSLLRICMIARMNAPSKNHRLFLRAAAAVRERLPQVKFILVGDGPLRPGLEREAEEMGLSACVQFLGERHDITAILASVDVSVLPSASESLSNVILESMAAGVPVVASRVGGNPELVTSDRGILTVPGDEQALAAAIERLLRDPSSRTEFGRNARRFAESNFTIASVQERYEELYAELLTGKESLKSRPSIGPWNASRNDRLRVAIVAPSLRYVGGQSVQADWLLSNWRDDPTVEANLIPIDPSFPHGLRWAESIPFLRTVLREPFYVFALWRGLQDADIVHIFSASYWSFLLAPVPAWIMARTLGKKTLVHYHSGEARDHLRRFRTARRVLAWVDRLVVPSAYLADVLREFGLAAQVVPNILDSSQFRFRHRRPLRPHLICTRGFHPYYRVDLVVRAFAEVQREFPDACLDLVGQGPEEPQIRNLVKDLKLGNVNFAGVASRLQIGGFYDAADIFINASCLDNMPVSIMEAFACGTPVVSTAPEGIRYLVEHERTGLLSEPGETGALAQNVIRLLKDPGLSSRLALSAYQESMRYSWSEVRGQWLEIYDAMAKGSGGAAERASSMA